MSTLKQTVQTHARKFAVFTSKAGGVRLRPYQQLAAEAVLTSIRLNLGLSVVVVFARQSGKDELAANLKAYLLARYVDRDASIVEINPTYKPQTINAISRLEDRLQGNLITRIHWRKHHDFIRLFGKAKVSFLSGEGTANVVGATASLLLIVNEAQDIQPSVYDKKLAPMAASTNATRLFMGTSWTSRTLLARELRAARHAEEQDHIRRVFVYDAAHVRTILPSYGAFVDGEVARLGRQHPLIKTQYFCEEIDAQSRMFNDARLDLMHGTLPLPVFPFPTPASDSALPPPNALAANAIAAAFLIDVGGQDEAVLTASGSDPVSMLNPGRDSTTLSVVAIDLSSLETLHAPAYHVVARYSWVGENHVSIFGRLKALAEAWDPQHIVIDATGVGEGLWAMLDKAFPTRVLPVKFSQQQKSDIGWRFLAVIETGRFRDSYARWAHTNLSSPQLGSTQPVDPLTVRLQYMNCQSEILPGPAKILRWGVPQGTRGPDGALLHDDFVLADSLVAVLDRLDWRVSFPSAITHVPDPLAAMGRPTRSSPADPAAQPRPSTVSAFPGPVDPLPDMSRIR